MKFGVQLWPQQTSWPAMARAAELADRSGWDSLWTWDHLLSVRAGPDRPILEGWLACAAIAARTDRIRIGLLVGANTLRNPGHTAKLAATLDHVSSGRAILGLGSGWFEPEHTAHGLEFGGSPGERLDRLDEAVSLIRRLLDGEEVTHDGHFYRFEAARHFPTPLQRRLPILIGGSGPKKTLRIVAQHADMWNTRGGPAELATSDALLREHCAAIGRDARSIERTCGVSMIIRDDPEEAHHALVRSLQPFDIGPEAVWPPLLGTPRGIAAGLRPYREIGFDHVITALQSPFDHETLERLGEVRDALAEADAAA